MARDNAVYADAGAPGEGQVTAGVDAQVYAKHPALYSLGYQYASLCIPGLKMKSKVEMELFAFDLHETLREAAHHSMSGLCRRMDDGKLGKAAGRKSSCRCRSSAGPPVGGGAERVAVWRRAA